MPLLDHFRPPVEHDLPWQSLHNGWIGELTARLNTILPKGYKALDTVRFEGRLEIDIGTYERPDSTNGTGGQGGTAVVTAPAVYTPPAAVGSFPTTLPGVSEVRVYTDLGGRHYVGAIELISPANKSKPEDRQAFAAKCVAYLAAGISVVVIDAVTVRRAVLHNDILRGAVGPPELELPAGTRLYAAAYRPVIRHGTPELDVWTETFAVGDTLPTMPLRLTGDTFVPVEFELTYTETCRRRRLFD